MDKTLIPVVLSSLPHLHADRPRRSKAMLDAHDAKMPTRELPPRRSLSVRLRHNSLEADEQSWAADAPPNFLPQY